MPDAHKPVSAEELVELKRLEREATPGPWTEADCGGAGNIPEVIRREEDGDWVPICYFSDNCGDAVAPDWRENRKLIAAARNALPRLLADLEAARAIIRQAHEALGEKAAHWHAIEGGMELRQGSECPGCVNEDRVIAMRNTLASYLAAAEQPKGDG